MPSLPVFLEILCFVWCVKVLWDLDVKHPAKSDRHICVSGKVKIVGYSIFDGMEPGLDKRQVIVYIIEKSLCVCRKGIGKHHFLKHPIEKMKIPSATLSKFRRWFFLSSN